MPIVLKSGSLKLLEPAGPVQACNGIALPLLYSNGVSPQKSSNKLCFWFNFKIRARKMYGMNLTEIGYMWEAGYDRLRCSCKFDLILLVISGSSVGIATDYGARGSGIKSRWGRDFPPIQTGPGVHPASCKMGTVSFPGVKCSWGVLLTTQPLLVPRSRKTRATPLPTLWATPGF